jgi:excisionase family DNA binding protein
MTDGNMEWITLAQAAEISGFSRGHLRLLLRQGKLKGTKLGRDWLTTKAAIREYLAMERKPGPKSQKAEDKNRD